MGKYFINLSVTHPYLYNLSLLTTTHHPRWGTFDLSNLEPDDPTMWLRRLAPYGIVSLELLPSYAPIEPTREHFLQTMSSTLRSLSLVIVSSETLIQLTCLTSLTVSRWRVGDDIKALRSLPLLSHYEFLNYCHEKLPSPEHWCPSTLTSLKGRLGLSPSICLN
jgi:hypothetical protein